MKILLVLQVLLLSFMFQTSSCRQQEESPMVKWKGNDDVNDLVFIFKKEATYEQRQKFDNEVLSKPRADGRGEDQPDGVLETMVGGIRDGYGGGIVNFRDEATPEQREKLRKAIESSPIIYKVYENAVPNKIDLPTTKKPDVTSTPDSHSGGNLKEMVESKGNDNVNDLVFIFKNGMTFEQRDTFVKEVIYNPQTGNGNNQRIMESIDIGRIKDYYKGGVINFSKEATPEQREDLKKAIESSPIVYKVYENVVPNKIDDLPNF